MKRQRKPMRRRSRKSKAQRDAEWAAYYGSEAYIEYLHAQPCLVDDCHEPAESSHLRHRGVTPPGTWRDQTPKCHGHHMNYHSQGPSRFCEVNDLLPDDLPRIAAYHAQQAIALGLVEVDAGGKLA